MVKRKYGGIEFLFQTIIDPTDPYVGRAWQKRAFEKGRLPAFNWHFAGTASLVRVDFPGPL